MPLFERRHHEELAKFIAGLDRQTRQELTSHFIVMFLRDNPRFKPARFEEACGVTPSEPDRWSWVKDYPTRSPADPTPNQPTPSNFRS